MFYNLRSRTFGSSVTSANRDSTSTAKRLRAPLGSMLSAASAATGMN